MLQVGQIVKANVSGEYAIAWEIEGTICELWSKDRVKIATPTGHKYLVHKDDLEVLNG